MVPSWFLVIGAVSILSDTAILTVVAESVQQHLRVALHPLTDELIILKGEDDPSSAARTIASADVRHSLNKTGWDYLRVRTLQAASSAAAGKPSGGKAPTDADYFRAVGMIEGYALRQQIRDYSHNIKHSAFDGGKVPSQLLEFMHAQVAYWRGQVNRAGKDVSPFWRVVGLLLAQLDGLVRGANHAEPQDFQLPEVSMDDILFIQYHIDAEEILRALRVQEVRHFRSGAAEPAEEPWQGERGTGSDPEAAAFFEATNTDRCSAIVKLVEPKRTRGHAEQSSGASVASAESELFMAHNTWTGYSEMNRVMKLFELPHVSALENPAVQFSSFPGAVASGDDFYTLGGAGRSLGVMETTNHCMSDEPLRRNVRPNSVVTTVRAMAANYVARDGSDWASTFAAENSGTQNNQWMVVDFGKFRAGAKAGVLTVLEQMPGLVTVQDQTAHLFAHSYWSSFNNPFYADQRELSGFSALANQSANPHVWEFFDYGRTPRRRLFARDHGKVVDGASLGALMRSNDYMHDEIGKGCPRYAIAARYELPGTETCVWWSKIGGAGLLEGAIDVKWASSSAGPSVDEEGDGAASVPLPIVAVSGPATNKNIPVFKWSAAPYAGAHQGQPDAWDFEWQVFDSSGPHPVSAAAPKSHLASGSGLLEEALLV